MTSEAGEIAMRRLGDVVPSADWVRIVESAKAGDPVQMDYVSDMGTRRETLYVTDGDCGYDDHHPTILLGRRVLRLCHFAPTKFVDENGLEMTESLFMWDWTGASWRAVLRRGLVGILSLFTRRSPPTFYLPGNVESSKGFRLLQRVAMEHPPGMDSGFGPDYLPQEVPR